MSGEHLLPYQLHGAMQTAKHAGITTSIATVVAPAVVVAIVVAIIIAIVVAPAVWHRVLSMPLQ